MFFLSPFVTFSLLFSVLSVYLPLFLSFFLFLYIFLCLYLHIFFFISFFYYVSTYIFFLSFSSVTIFFYYYFAVFLPFLFVCRHILSLSISIFSVSVSVFLVSVSFYNNSGKQCLPSPSNEKSQKSIGWQTIDGLFLSSKIVKSSDFFRHFSTQKFWSHQLFFNPVFKYLKI